MNVLSKFEKAEKCGNFAILEFRETTFIYCNLYEILNRNF